MKKINIYPSLLAIADRVPEWNAEIQKVSTLASGIHYDIGDAELVPTLMLDVADIAEIQTDLPIDIHLMVARPSEYLEEIFAYSAVEAIAFHVECDEDIHEIIQEIRNAGKKAGLAILDTTPVDHLDPYLLEVDYIIVMTVKAGYSGTSFIPEMLTKVTEIHNKNPELSIIVDGGINQNTLNLCMDAGATSAVMGAALFSGKDTDWLL